MKLLFTAALLLLFTASFSQTINRDLLYGKWVIEGVMVNGEVLSLSSADTLAQKISCL